MPSSYYTYTTTSDQDRTNPSEQPIEVTPVDVISESQTATGEGSATPVNAYVVEEAPRSSAPKSKIGSAASIVAGGAIALVGVPMLVLPGPGLLAIGGGLALMARGAKGFLGGTK